MLDPKKLILMVAPNGARKSKKDHPALPISPDELALCAEECLAAGASMLHLHVRDKDGGHTIDADTYRKALKAIDQQVGKKLIIQVTSEAVGMYNTEQQMAMVRDLKPEAVSLALRELCPEEADEKAFHKFIVWMRQEHVMPQYILYSPEEVLRFINLKNKGLFLDDLPQALFVVGRGQKNLALITDNLLDPFMCNIAKEDFPWSVCSFGPMENKIALKASSMGGHCRIGYENNIYLNNGNISQNNAQLIRQFSQMISSGNRILAKADEIREAYIF